MRTFTYRELVGHEVPAQTSFHEIVELLEKVAPDIADLACQPGFNDKLVLVAVVAIGSAARGDFDCSSDLDVFFCLDDSKVEAGNEMLTVEFLWTAREVLKRVSRRAEELHVKLEIVLALESQLSSEFLCFDERFLAHAVRAAKSGGLLYGTGGELEAFVAGAPPQTPEWMRRYVEKSIVSIGSAILVDNPEDHDAVLYGLVFMRPFHATRKYLTFLGLLYEDSTAGLIKACEQNQSEHPSLKELAQHLLALSNYRKRYVEYVETVRVDWAHVIAVPQHPGVGKQPVFEALKVLQLLEIMVGATATA